MFNFFFVSACDMFEFDKNTGICHFMPHTALKSKAWASFTQSGTAADRRSIFVLHCSATMDNLAPEAFNYLNDAIKPIGVTTDISEEIDFFVRKFKYNFRFVCVLPSALLKRCSKNMVFKL